MDARDYMLERLVDPTVLLRSPQSDNPIGAGNQQGRPVSTGTLRGHTSRARLASAKGDDMVRSPWRHGEVQGTPTGHPWFVDSSTYYVTNTLGYVGSDDGKSVADRRSADQPVRQRQCWPARADQPAGCRPARVGSDVCDPRDPCVALLPRYQRGDELRRRVEPDVHDAAAWRQAAVHRSVLNLLAPSERKLSRQNRVKQTGSAVRIMHREFALGYLLAAAEGEGSFMLKPATDVRTLREGRPSLSISARFEVENTSVGYLDKFQAALAVVAIDVGFRVVRNFRDYDKTPYFKRYGFLPGANTVLGGGKKYYRLAVTSRADVRRLIDVLRDQWDGKAKVVAIIEEFLDRAGDSKRYLPTVEDIALCKEVFELQGRRRKPYPTEKWLACLDGDYGRYLALKDEPTPYQAGDHEDHVPGRRRD